MKTSAKISKTETDSPVHASSPNKDKSSFFGSVNQESEMFFSPVTLQPKLKMGQPNMQNANEGSEIRIQRQGRGSSPNHAVPDISGFQLRSPVLEETLSQSSTILSHTQAGRPMTTEEMDLAKPIFGNSIRYENVRIVKYGMSNKKSTKAEGKRGFDIKGSYMVLGNTIYVPPEFSIANRRMAQTLIHELVHIWQYQTGGTRYISSSIVDQLSGSIGSGSRNAAYGYQVTPGKTFFDYGPEQQGQIVENYFAMINDQQIISDASINEYAYDFYSNHNSSSGYLNPLTPNQRLNEIRQEITWHRERVDELRAVVPMTELQQLQLQSDDLMRTPGQHVGEIPNDRQMIPLRPIFELRW